MCLYYYNNDLDVQALKFDTLSYVKQLTSAGVEPQVAEIHAMTMANAFGMYIDNVVTTDYLDATLDKRFAEFDLRMERRFAEQSRRIDDLALSVNHKFADQDSKFEARFNKLELALGSLNSVVRINTAIMFLLLANVALPALSKFLS